MYSADSRWLETVGSPGSIDLPSLYGRPELARAEPLRSITRAVMQNEMRGRIVLPLLLETRQLFKEYEENVDALQHIIYVPAVHKAIDGLYDCLRTAQPPKWSHAVLVLSILSSIAGYWGLGDATNTPFCSPRESLAVAMYWVRSSLDVLDHAWRTSQPDLESVQASIVLFFLIYYLEGFSPKLRHLQGTAIMQAKDMGLHLTDSLHNKRPEETREQIIDAEMRRRVWWHLASTDWSTSLAGSPHEGTYSVQVKHMQVRRPRNITDEDLATQPADFSRPVEEATANSYYLQRISLAEVCREAADLLWDIYAVRDPEQIEYDRVKQLDAKFAGLLDNLPNALRLDHLKGGDQRTESVTTNHLMKQSHFTYLTVEVRRSKVHLPFLLRAERDHRYAFSRTQCLASARNVLALRHVLPHEQSSSGGPVFLIGVLHHFFCAMVVLVMDVCVNKAAGHEEERRQEVKEACGILERARERSSVANTFLESLMTILKKHGVRCQNPTAPPVSTGFAAGWGTAAGINDFTSTTPILADPNLAVDGVMSDTLNFDDLWQSYFDMGPQLDPESWNDIFNDLEMRVDP